MKFNGKLLIIGCGSVSQCAIPLVLKLIKMPPSKITIMDFVDNRVRIKDALEQGIKYVINRVTQQNYPELLGEYVGPGDMIIDLAWNIDCLAMVKWCRDNQVLYVNTSVEDWDPLKMLNATIPPKTPFTPGIWKFVENSRNGVMKMFLPLLLITAPIRDWSRILPNTP